MHSGAVSSADGSERALGGGSIYRVALIVVLALIAWGCGSNDNDSNPSSVPSSREPASTAVFEPQRVDTSSEPSTATSVTQSLDPGDAAGFSADGIPFHLDILPSVGEAFEGDFVALTLDGAVVAVGSPVRPLGDPADDGCPFRQNTFFLASGTHVVEAETGRTERLVVVFELSAEAHATIYYRDPSFFTWQDFDRPTLFWEIRPGRAPYRINQDNRIDVCPRLALVPDADATSG